MHVDSQEAARTGPVVCVCVCVCEYACAAESTIMPCKQCVYVRVFHARVPLTHRHTVASISHKQVKTKQNENKTTLALLFCFAARYHFLHSLRVYSVHTLIMCAQLYIESMLISSSVGPSFLPSVVFFCSSYTEKRCAHHPLRVHFREHIL